MTREEAIKTLKSNYPSSCYTMLREAVDIAIEALSQHSLPSNLDEAAIDAAQLDMQDRQIMEATNDERLRYSRIFRRGFKAGAEWTAEQGVSFDTEMSWLDSFGFQIGWPENTSIFDCFNPGDKVVVQIRKK